MKQNNKKFKTPNYEKTIDLVIKTQAPFAADTHPRHMRHWIDEAKRDLQNYYPKDWLDTEFTDACKNYWQQLNPWLNGSKEMLEQSVVVCERPSHEVADAERHILSRADR